MNVKMAQSAYKTCDSCTSRILSAAVKCPHCKTRCYKKRVNTCEICSVEITPLAIRCRICRGTAKFENKPPKDGVNFYLQTKKDPNIWKKVGVHVTDIYTNKRIVVTAKSGEYKLDITAHDISLAELQAGLRVTNLFKPNKEASK